jgi:hypothetical protein
MAGSVDEVMENLCEDKVKRFSLASRQGRAALPHGPERVGIAAMAVNAGKKPTEFAACHRTNLAPPLHCKSPQPTG